MFRWMHDCFSRATLSQEDGHMFKSVTQELSERHCTRKETMRECGVSFLTPSGRSKVTRGKVGRDIDQPTKVFEFVKLILRPQRSQQLQLQLQIQLQLQSTPFHSTLHRTAPHPHTTHHAPRTTHHAPRATHHAPRTTRHAPRATRHAAHATHSTPRTNQ